MCLEDDATVDSDTPTNDNDGVEFINMDVECSGMVMILGIGRHSGVRIVNWVRFYHHPFLVSCAG